MRDTIALVEQHKAEGLQRNEQLKEYNYRSQKLYAEIARDHNITIAEIDQIAGATPLSQETDRMLRSLMSWLEKQHSHFVPF